MKIKSEFLIHFHQTSASNHFTILQFMFKSKLQEARENPNNPQEIRSSLESNLIPKIGYLYKNLYQAKIQKYKISRNNLT